MKMQTDKSKVQTRSGEQDGEFRSEMVPVEDWSATYVSPQSFVDLRLEYLEEAALGAIRRCGFEDWPNVVLLINGTRKKTSVSDEFFEATTTEERRRHLLAEAGLNLQKCTWMTLPNFVKPLSLGAFAWELRKACGLVRNAISCGDGWEAAKQLSMAEQALAKITIALMEEDYIRGKRQRNSEQTDKWPEIRNEYLLNRPKYKTAAECRQYICQLYGVTDGSLKKQIQRN